jgi:hypothetical protein
MNAQMRSVAQVDMDIATGGSMLWQHRHQAPGAHPARSRHVHRDAGSASAISCARMMSVVM